MLKDYVDRYLEENIQLIHTIDRKQIVRAAELLIELKHGEGRLFLLGVGGSAANASHAVNDFRKICGIECYAPTDNISELTARVNDEGWEVVFESWLRTSKINSKDVVLVLSVGGGTEKTSNNLIRAMDVSKEVGAKILSIVSRDGGYALKVSDVCILIPVVAEDHITPHAESWQAVIWHLLVNAIVNS